MYNLLLDEGADPDAQDSFGNMILHMVVVTDQLVINQFKKLKILRKVFYINYQFTSQGMYGYVSIRLPIIHTPKPRTWGGGGVDK